MLVSYGSSYLKSLSNLFKTCVFMMFVLLSSLNHIPIKFRGLIKTMEDMGYNEIGLYVQNMLTILGLLVNGNGQCNMLKRKKIFTLNIYLNFESLILVMRDEMTIFVMLTK